MIAQNRRYAYILGVGAQDLEDWTSSVAPIQVGGNGSLIATRVPGASGFVGLGQNVYWDGSWKYQDTDEASYYFQQDGTHQFRIAASGTADTAITWITAMTINNDGTVTVPKGDLVVDGN